MLDSAKGQLIVGQFTGTCVHANRLAEDLHWRRAAGRGARREGPLIVLIHGFPESWYSWRHQIPVLAEAGFRVAAPDVRGYGGSDKPLALEAYAIKEMCADIGGLIAALGAERAIVVGHDWGAPIAYGT